MDQAERTRQREKPSAPSAKTLVHGHTAEAVGVVAAKVAQVFAEYAIRAEHVGSEFTHATQVRVANHIERLVTDVDTILDQNRIAITAALEPFVPAVAVEALADAVIRGIMAVRIEISNRPEGLEDTKEARIIFALMQQFFKQDPEGLARRVNEFAGLYRMIKGVVAAEDQMTGITNAFNRIFELQDEDVNTDVAIRLICEIKV